MVEGCDNAGRTLGLQLDHNRARDPRHSRQAGGHGRRVFADRDAVVGEARCHRDDHICRGPVRSVGRERSCPYRRANRRRMAQHLGAHRHLHQTRNTTSLRLATRPTSRSCSSCPMSWGRAITGCAGISVSRVPRPAARTSALRSASSRRNRRTAIFLTSTQPGSAARRVSTVVSSQ